MLFSVVCVVLLALTYSSDAAKNDKNGGTYTTRYDHVDVDAILKSNRLLRSYMKCVLDQGPCTREGVELRKNLPEAIQTDCVKCSKTQKLWAGKIMAWLLQYEQGYWNQLLAKYDPDKTFQKRFNAGSDDDDEDY